MTKAYKYQNIDKIEESVECIEKIAQNFHILGSLSDQFQATQEIIREHREILSQNHIDKIYGCDDKEITSEEKKIYFSNPKPKGKQIKNPWTEQEQKLFIEGLDKFGNKSNLNNYIILFRSKRNS